jgi:hypothetical protein
LHGERCHLLRDIFDRDIEAGRVLDEPAQARIRGSPSIALLAQARDGPVVDDLALLIAPWCVIHLANGKLRRIARDEQIDEPGRITSADEVLEERRDVDQRCRVADRVVLVLVVRPGTYRVLPPNRDNSGSSATCVRKAEPMGMRL